MENITIKDIAKALNLSTSTVSRALRDSYEINEATKQMVLDYATKFNYHPNPIALSLKENKSKTLGVIVPEIDNPFFSQTIDGIEEVAYQRGYHVVICQSHESYAREVANTEYLASRRVDGLLISLSSQTQEVSHLKTLQAKGLPIVFFDRVSEEIDTHKVVVDNFSGAFDATESLILSGRKRIAHIAASPNLSITKERLEGYLAALHKYQLPPQPELIQYCNYQFEDIQSVVFQLLSKKIDAILTVSDRLALACLAALRNKNISIPQEIALIGFTNLNVADLLSPPLSTVVQPAFEMGQKSVELLLTLVEKKKNQVIPYQKLLLHTYLERRTSSLSSK